MDEYERQSMALSPPKKKTRHISKRLFDKTRNRVDIGGAFLRWRRLRQTKNIKSDAELAIFLLDSYEGPSTSTPSKAQWTKSVAPALSSICPSDGDLSCESLERESTLDAPEALEQSLHNMNVQSEPHMMDESEFNDLRNSVIDWGTDEEDDENHDKDDNSHDEDDNSQDEDYVPHISIRIGGALPTSCIDSLPIISMSDVVHDIDAEIEPPSAHIPMPPTILPAQLEVLAEDDLIGKRASICYEDCLKQLAAVLMLPIKQCPYRCPRSHTDCPCLPPFEVSITARGTASIMEWTCPAGHTVWKWTSQPTVKYSMLAGDFMLATNILLSGSNYAKVSLLFKFMNIEMVNRSTYFAIQDTFCVDTIKECWLEKRVEMKSHLQDKDVVIVADGRMDSPGHCAQYCTYTAMENDTRAIISVITIDKRETSRNSVIMEKEAFIRTMDGLLSELKLVEVCTDAHVQISALMNKGKYKDLGVQHSLDMWHGAKNLAKRINAAAQIRGQSCLNYWLKDIVNHFWWCCKVAGSYQRFLELWFGLAHHVVNEHTWVLGGCHHEEHDTSKQWLTRGSAPHEALKTIMRNKRWLKEVHKYLNFRSTAELESFQNHILMYASKRTAYTPPVFEARTILAAMDYNFHLDRPELPKPDGSKQYRRLYKKQARRYSVYTVKAAKTYGHIPNLQARILHKRLTGKGMPRRRSLRPHDPRRLGLLPPVPAPTLDELVRTQVGRCLVPELPEI
ncbi:hypothetical protein AALO_G00085400 [Alosa alosa]|uniref:Transposase n=2 Tax=Alosa alosa TaxID=278164 RepID=A0AAV6GYD8_9TELE|nr:hypothetical protein AALO_G00085400 [Alosa alosa]